MEAKVQDREFGISQHGLEEELAEKENDFESTVTEKKKEIEELRATIKGFVVERAELEMKIEAHKNEGFQHEE